MPQNIYNIALNIIDNSVNACICLKPYQIEPYIDCYTVFINRAFESLFHIGQKEIEGIPFSTVLQDMSFKNENLKNIIDVVYSSGKTYKETVYSYKYSKYYYVSFIKVTDEYVCGIFTDVSDYEDTRDRLNDLYDKVAASEEELRYQVDLLIATQDKLIRSEEIYKLISEASNDGFLYTNLNTNFNLASTKWYELFHIPKEEVDNKQLFVDQIYNDDKHSYYTTLSRIAETKEKEFQMEYRLVDGKTWIKHSGVLKYDENHNCIEEISFFKDITDLKENQTELERMAYYDPLTGLYNRNFFMRNLEQALMDSSNLGNIVQIIYMDVDNFKKVNDSLGFIVGDELMIAFSRILLKYKSDHVKIGRFNNDEFVIALLDASNEMEAERIYRDIRKQLDKPIRIDNGLEIYLNISVGIAWAANGSMTADDLVKCADIAMYSVKERGKNSMLFFEDSMLHKFINNVLMEQRLKTAVENMVFYLYYQPQYDAASKKLRGVEALIRWNDNKLGMVSPGEFIPLAEKIGCIIPIGTWVIKQSIREYAEWKREYGYEGIISINISSIQLKDKNFVETLLYHVRLNQIDTKDVEIEITESVFIDEFECTLEIISILRENGFRVSLDDFGTGYSSLSYLKDIPIDTLKIDKSFVDTMIIDQSTSIITSSVINMVRKLGLETIAEGVETEAQYEYLKMINCDNIQGFYLGRPMDGSAIRTLIETENRRVYS